PSSQAVVTALEKPVGMSFANDTPLADVLKYIKAELRLPNGNGIPIYVDPVGLAQAESKETSPVRIDVDGIPLRTSLRLVLKQLNLAYCVKDGLLIISSVEGVLQELKEARETIEQLAQPVREEVTQRSATDPDPSIQLPIHPPDLGQIRSETPENRQ